MKSQTPILKLRGVGARATEDLLRQALDAYGCSAGSKTGIRAINEELKTQLTILLS